MAINEFIGPEITKARGGLGRVSTDVENVSGMVIGAVATANMLLGTIYKLVELRDLEDLLVDADYDTDNDLLLHYHVAQFFYYNPTGVLYILPIAQSFTQEVVCNKENDYLYKLLTDDFTNREIRNVAVVFNPAVDYQPAFTNGLETTLLEAIPFANELAVDLRLQHIYIDSIILDGFVDPIGSLSTTQDLRALNCEYVSVNIAQDKYTKDLGYDSHTAMGAVLAMKAIRKVSECLGSVDIARKPEFAKGSDTYTLTVPPKGWFLNASIGFGDKKYSELTETQKNLLATKGYIYAGRFEGLDGFYFNDSHTCTAITSDYAYMEDNSVWNKAVRLLRRALLPLMRSEVDIDSTTGFISASAIAYYESKAQKAVNIMNVNSEIVGDAIVYISPTQNVVGTGVVEMDIKYIRKGILRRLKANVGAINPAV